MYRHLMVGVCLFEAIITMAFVKFGTGINSAWHANLVILVIKFIFCISSSLYVIFGKKLTILAIFSIGTMVVLIHEFVSVILYIYGFGSPEFNGEILTNESAQIKSVITSFILIIFAPTFVVYHFWRNVRREIVVSDEKSAK